MIKNLVIVESPAKAKTIGRYLGKDFRITASVGHIRDLPASTIGVDVLHGFKPTYINMRGKEKVIKEMKELAQQAEMVYIATDPDREGEAIAWHIAKLLGVDQSEVCRISFNEITQKAVQTALSVPRVVNLDLVNAQQARRILDRLVGYELSPLLWKKIRKGLSAGRVQSVTTKMVVDREALIEAFIPEEYWLISADFSPISSAMHFRSRYHGEHKNGKTSKNKLTSKEEVDALIADLDGKEYVVQSVKKRQKHSNPFAPFTTSTLQQEASRRMGYASRKTMSVAQQLYEGVEIKGHGQVALVSYIRTDSVRVSDEAAMFARDIILSKFGDAYVPKSARKYANKNSSQDAHEAIRPVHFELSPESIQDSLSGDQYRLYKLIWDRFISSQMASADIDTLTLDIACNQHIFRSQGETVTFQGFLAQYSIINDDKNDDDKEDTKIKLPSLQEGEKIKLHALSSEQKFTQPPARYTEATLIKSMEEKGIGRPSTYAPTISTILERNYVDKQNKYLLPTELGVIVTTLLAKNFANIVDTGFTASMEESLDEIELGKKNWVDILSTFYGPFHELVVKASNEVAKVELPVTDTGEKCPDCLEGNLIIKEGRYGKFVACSNFPECKYTKNVETVVPGICPICGSGLVSRVSRKFRGRVFYTCDKKGTDSQCPFISWYLPVEGQKCEICDGYMVWKKFRGKAYPRCASRECPSNQRKKSKPDADKEESSVEVTDTQKSESE